MSAGSLLSDVAGAPIASHHRVPPPIAVQYVGRSRALDQRCASHPEEHADHLVTLNLPPLALEEARELEEALIAHVGPSREIANDLSRLGQLEDLRHEISPGRETYSERLLVGQFVLLENGYGAYAVAASTREKDCQGVGGPR